MNKQDFYNINNEIRSDFVRVTGDNIESKIVKLSEALKIAKDMNLDLVQIVSNTNPPICKITDFQKFLYEKKFKEKELKKNQRKSIIKTKEIRLTYNTGEHDFNFKLNNAKEFLKKSNKVKISMVFSGREIQYKNQGELLLLKFIDELNDLGKIENLPKLENKKLWVLVNPK